MPPLLLDNKPAYQDYETGPSAYRRPTREGSDLEQRFGRGTTDASRGHAPGPGEDDVPRVNSRHPSLDDFDRPRRREPRYTRRAYDEYEYYRPRRRSREESRYRYRSRDRVDSPYRWEERREVEDRQVHQKKVRSLDGTRDLVINFNLGSKASALAGLKWNPNTKSWDAQGRGYISKASSKLNVLSSTSFSDRPEATLVELKCDTEWGERDTYFLRWRHLEQPALDFDDFVQAATGFKGLSEEQNLVVDHLLATVRKELERTYVHGKYLAPGSVRCDGTDSKDPKREDVTAMFVCSPYFAFEDHRARYHNILGKAASDLHQSRTILQWQYDGESTRERDASQALGSGSASKLHVPTIWSLVIGAEVLLTAAPASMQTLMHPNIVKLPKPNNIEKGRMVQVSDPYKRQYFFPMDSCKTFFELRQLVNSQCLEDIGLDESLCDFLLNSDETLQASKWISIANDATATLVVVSVVEKEEPRKLMALGDGRDSDRDAAQPESDEANSRDGRAERDAPWTQDPRAWQVTVKRRRTETPPGLRTRESKAVRALERQGLVVNNPGSLTADKDKKSRAPEDVPMFQPQTTPEEAPQVALEAQAAPEDPSQLRDTSTPAAAATTANDDDAKKPASNQPPTNALNASTTKPKAAELPEPPKMTLRIPPFLTWRLDKDVELQNGKKRLTVDLDGLNKIMGSLEKKLKSRDYNIKEPSTYKIEDEFWLGKSYQETNEEVLSQLRSLVKDLDHANPANGSTTADVEANKAPGSDKTGSSDLMLFTDPNELLIRKRTQEMRDVVKMLVRLSEDIVSTFAPTSYDSELLRKIWGSLVALIAICSDEPETSDSKAKKITWVIRQTTSRSGEDVDVPVPMKHFLDCTQCCSFTTYESAPVALKHLVSEHYAGRRSFNASERKALETTVLRTATMARLQTTRRALKFLLDVNSFMTMLHAKVHDMAEGLANADKDDPTAALTFGIPITLVQAFEQFFNFLAAAGRVMPLMHRNYSGWTPSNADDWDSRFSKYANFIHLLGFRADMALSDAMKDIVLLIRRGEASESVNYTAVGPRYIAFTFMQSLLLNKLSGDDGIVELCTKKTSNLQYQVLHRPPRRRLLADIQALQEEITAVRDIRDQQNDAMWEAVENCSPDSFRITSQSRKQQYELEFKVAVTQLRNKLSTEATALEKLLTRLTALEDKARYRIEVLEEDNSKTIFVFTVVTAVFLPLSFVTSYLGMNTTDIRNTTTTQTTFWAIALPVTVVVVALAILAAYKGDFLVDHIVDMRRGMRERQRTRRNETERHSGSELPRRDTLGSEKDIV